MKKTAKTFKALPVKQKGKIASGLMKEIDKPISVNAIATAFVKELRSIVTNVALDTKLPDLEERPGKVRLLKYTGGDDVYPNQVHIFKVNDIRTSDYLPALTRGDFKPEEFQQVCEARRNGDEVKWDCTIQRQPCEGNEIGNVCLRVLQVQAGSSVTLTGVNYFDIKAKVWMRKKGSTGAYKKIKAFVYGDVTTPVHKTVNGKRRLIADKRVSDKIFFTIPADTAPAIYGFQVAVPNNQLRAQYYPSWAMRLTVMMPI